ncbi:hypothetical protein GCM10009678_54380 [Actinomadura kijaniata]|uniref:Uncharacterized protein n=1 Tax=Actinomadura namibiensis TaxID=182080 RepID=A0A7W3LRK6_ACTNM|nr:hypothetical protein [Actinomadura namibiensis]MBA8952927.1 hypothetical protein [Actinomadura namibiensis]
MALRVQFTEAQTWGGITDTQLTVDAARVVLLDSNDQVVLDVPADVLRQIDRGAVARTSDLRGRHRNHGKAWSKEERTALREMWATAAPWDVLIQQFGRSRNSITSEARRLGLGERAATPGS